MRPKQKGEHLVSLLAKKKAGQYAEGTKGGEGNDLD